MLVGRELGPYIVEKELGSGAMGTVYRARHKTSGDKVAVKILSAAVAGNEAAKARFSREITILKQLNHPNIVRYLGSGRYHKDPFYVMEYVDGESLDRVMARRDRMTWEEVVDLGVPLCSALQHAHDKGIIHRDLKPSNVMVLRDGTVKLADFGIAKDCDLTALTGANSTVGTAAYMAPEQCRGTKDLTNKCDLYSLGVMFFELITGRKPFTAESTLEMFQKHANEEAPRPSRLVPNMPMWMDTLICQLMEKKPEQRPYNADRVGKALLEVKEKVQTQLSAGVDTAKKRRVDRTTRDHVLDDTDKDAARALLGKKKKKKKKTAFYQKGWFTVSAVALIVLGLVAGIYVVFLQAPSADRLYKEAEAVMKSKKLDEQRAARKADGPISEFLYYHPNDARAAQVQKWADQIDAEETENALLNRRRTGFKVPESEAKADEAAREALDLEEMGRLDDAARRWGDLMMYKKEKDADLRGWGLLGEKRQRDLKAVDKLYEDLKNKLQSEKLLKTKEEIDSEAERLALDAVRAEETKSASARTDWENLKKLTQGKDEPEQRRFFLLAARRLLETEKK